MKERTLIIFKPDCMLAKIEGIVLDRFLKNGFEIKASKMIKMTDEILKKHYAHLVNESFFPLIVEFMKEQPVMVCILERDDAIKTARLMIGETDSKKATQGTIRADFGENNRRNVVHASDSIESAEREISIYFSPSEIC